jgi:hypothetical protein
MIPEVVGGEWSYGDVISWIPGQRLWKVDCIVRSPMSSVAGVVAPLLCCVDDEEWTAGDPGVGGTLVVATPRTCSRGLFLVAASLPSGWDGDRGT